MLACAHQVGPSALATADQAAGTDVERCGSRGASDRRIGSGRSADGVADWLSSGPGKNQGLGDGRRQGLDSSRCFGLPELVSNQGPTNEQSRRAVLAVRAVEAHRPRPQPQKITLDRGLQLRIAPDGKRTLRVRCTVQGSHTERQYRLPQAYGEGPGQPKLAAAGAEAARIRTLARSGVDWTAAEDARPRSEAAGKAAPQRRDGLALEKALSDHVENERRAKDGRGLKARTRADYLAMVQGARTTEKGTRQAAGFQFPMARTPLTELTACNIRDAYDAAVKKSPRRAGYAMQVLRAVLRGHRVVVPDNPLGPRDHGPRADHDFCFTWRPGADPAGTAGRVVACGGHRAFAGGGRLLPVPAADGLSRHGDPRAQAAWPPAAHGR